MIVFQKKEGSRNDTVLTFYPRVYGKSSVVLDPMVLAEG